MNRRVFLKSGAMAMLSLGFAPSFLGRAAAAVSARRKLVISDAQQDNSKQVAQVETFIRQKPDLLIVAPNERAALTAVMAQAMEAKIPVICLERDILQPNYTSYIHSDNVAIGRLAGLFIVDHLKKKYGTPRGNVVAMRGLLGVEGVATAATRTLAAVPNPTRILAAPQPQQPQSMPLSARYSQPGGLWIAGRPVNPDLRVTLSPLRHGAIVGLGGAVGAGAHDTDVGGVAEVRVVGGPDAGRVHRLPLG